MDNDAPVAANDPVTRLRAEQVADVFSNAPMGVSGALFGGWMLVLSLAAGATLTWPRALAWLAAISAAGVAHLVLAAAYRRCEPAASEWRRWALPFTLLALAEGLCWGYAALWLVDPAHPQQRLIAILVVCVITTGGVWAFGTFLPSFLALFLPAMPPYIVWALVAGSDADATILPLDVVFSVAMPLLARHAAARFAESQRLRFALAELAETLREQKEAAERAIHARARFLAAASHDLRQPVHALGLLAGALTGRQMDQEARDIVDHITASTAALDELFSALLDISRLDAGVVEVRREMFPIGLLLARLAREYGAEAAAKGLVLRAVRCSALVETDPVLLERILRNLLSNAVRYTERGRILLGCRRHDGAIRVEVWDTGIGIEPDAQSLIFEEFYQIGNAERDRAKGLGLGLAIVRRVSATLGLDLALDSLPGQGSVFRVSVPRARAGPPATLPDPAASFVASGVVAQSAGLIVVVDDELAIREAMRRLLESWGHRVLAAGSGAEASALLAAEPRPPDAILCDYRLRAGEDGIAVILELQSHYDITVPAALITGDTGPERLRQAQASGLLVLQKPLGNARLRAAVGALLRGASALRQGASVEPPPPPAPDWPR